jgi:hypothetical protein
MLEIKTCDALKCKDNEIKKHTDREERKKEKNQMKKLKTMLHVPDHRHHGAVEWMCMSL